MFHRCRTRVLQIAVFTIEVIAQFIGFQCLVDADLFVPVLQLNLAKTGEFGYNICKGKLSFPITNILDPTTTSPTLTATDSNKLAVIIDNTFIRKLNDNELKLLCGFPLSYKLPVDVDKYDLFGNMVIPNVVEGVLKCVF